MEKKKNIESLEQLAIDSKLAAWDIIIKQVIDKPSTDDTKVNKENLSVVLSSLNTAVLEGYLSYLPSKDVAKIYYFIADCLATAKPGKELKTIMEASRRM